MNFLILDVYVPFINDGDCTVMNFLYIMCIPDVCNGDVNIEITLKLNHCVRGMFRGYIILLSLQMHVIS